jgi:hypothetical protein
MPDIREAVEAVIEHLATLRSLAPTKDPRLEEYHYDEDESVWNLVFSFEDISGAQRIFRTFQVNDFGEILSMKTKAT